jgi:PAS domain S-box-containing protein
MRNRLGVRGRLFLAFFGISAFAVLAAAAAMYSFLEVGRVLDQITQRRVPQALTSLEIPRQSDRIVAMAPALLTVGTPSQREELAARITAETERLNALLSRLERGGGSATTVASIESNAAQLRTNLAALDALVARRLDAAAHKGELLKRLSNTHNAVQRLVTPGLMVVEGDLAQLSKVLDTPDLSAEERVASISGMVNSITESAPLQRAQVENLAINDSLLRVAAAPRTSDVQVLAFPVRRSLKSLETLATVMDPMLRGRLLARIREFHALLDGDGSIPQARERELAIIADGQRLLDENAALSGELTEAVGSLVVGAKRDIFNANLEARSVQRLSTGVLIAVVAFSLISSTLIVWLYVGRNLIARLTALSGSMLAIARSELETPIPAAGRDEIGDMAKALTVFRDTAIEVKESNLREIREARRRLTDAIESISEGFSLFDSEDRLVISNSRYREMLYPKGEALVEAGTPFETMIRTAAEKGHIKDAVGRVDDWVSERLARHRAPGAPHLHQRDDGRWIRVSERRTEGGGIVAVYTDITELKQAEQALRESEQRYALAVRAIDEGIFEWDVDTDGFYYSPGVREMLGLNPEHVRSRLDFFERTHPDDRQRYRDAYVALFKGETERLECDIRYRNSAGDWRWARQHAVAVRGEDGRVHRVVGASGDITERKEAEEELRQNQALFDHAARLASLGHWAYDELEDKAIYASEEIARIHGVTAEEHVSTLSSTEKDVERAHPEDRARLEQVLRQAKAAARPYDVEYRIVRPDGEIRHVRELGEPVLDETGTLVRSFGTIQDITERKHAEEELRESRELLYAVIDAVPAMISAKDSESRYIVINRYQSELYDVSRDEAIGKTAAQLLNREYGDYTRQLDRQVIDSGEALPPYEEHHVDASGGERELLATKVPLKDHQGRVRGVVTVAHDITDRKQAEQALRESEMRFSQAARLANLGHWAWDEIEDKCTYCSEELARIHGVSVEDYLLATETVEGDLARIHPEDRDEYNRVTREWAGREDTYDIKYRIIRPDGETRHVHELAEAIRDKKGRLARSIGTKQDITARIHAENEVRKSREQLQALADNLPEFISMKDSEERFIFVNKKFEEWVCQNRDDVIGKTVYDVYGDGQAQEFHDLDRKVLDGRQAMTEEVDLAYPDGRTRAIIRTHFPVISARGEMLGLGTVNRDITARKRAEEAVIEAKRRAEEASKQVTEKNQMLESLSNQLSKYLSPQVYATIFAGQQRIEIASKRKKLTVFFSDIADFTGTTDSLESEELTNLLNHYLTEMSKIALDHGATIDKYVGDAIIAFFGDPETRGVKQDAQACVDMAIAMQRRMQELQSEWLDMGLERPFQLRIGINTGFCTVGNFGSEDRMDYTIIGNEVNLAARLEAVADVGSILLAHETYALVKDRVMAEESGTLTVRGFAKPVRIYEVVGIYDDLAKQGRVIRKDQGAVQVLVDLKKGDKADAIQAIEDVLSELKGRADGEPA